MLKLTPCCSAHISVRLRKLEPVIFGHFTQNRHMMTDKVEQHWISRLNKQVNYKRIFHSPEKVEVIIPTIPYQSFDVYLSGTRIKPWNLIDLVVSMRLFTQYPVENAGNPDDSIVDNHFLQKENFLFTATMKMDINRTFHNPESPKFPLNAEVEVTHVGNSSTRRVYTVRHTDSSEPYITCAIDDVIVNKISRRPAAFPEWWQQKFSYLKRSKQKFEKPVKNSDSFTSRSEFQIEFEHMDHNLHTTMSAYLKFCMNAAFKTVVSEKHDCYLRSEHLHAGVKCIHMFFHSESNYGDSMIVDMFENKSNVNEVYFEIKKRSATQGNEIVCCVVVLEFYEPTQTKINGKL